MKEYQLAKLVLVRHKSVIIKKLNNHENKIINFTTLFYINHLNL